MTWQNDVDDDFLGSKSSDKYIDLSRKHSLKSKMAKIMFCLLKLSEIYLANIFSVKIYLSGKVI